MGSAFKKRLKTQPTIEDIIRATNELMTDGHRGIAVLGAALLEDLLRVGILYNMRTLSTAEQDKLFSGYGPLSSFSTKIQIAYAIGLIGPNVTHDLETIREIRNGFAHTALQVDFGSPEVIALCNGLHCRHLIHKQKHGDAKTLFAAAVRLLMIHLISKFPEHDGSIPKDICGLD